MFVKADTLSVHALVCVRARARMPAHACVFVCMFLHMDVLVRASRYRLTLAHVTRMVAQPSYSL
jgi:hypothetical protein